MDSMLTKLQEELVLNYEQILINQKKEFEDLEKIAISLLGESYKELFPLSKSYYFEKLSTNENTIEKYVDFIREKWQERVFYHTYKMYRSPKYGEVKETLNGKKLEFGYERTLKPLELEQHLYKNVEGYTGFSMLFSNAMSSLSAIYSLVNKLYRKKSENIKCLAMIGYFEALSLSLEYNKNVDIHYIINQEDFSSLDFEEYDFFMLEPVRTTFNLDITNVEKLLKSLLELKSNKLKILVFDSSLLGSYFNISQILMFLKNRSDFVIIDVRSGLKMDQQGMELSNCGLMSVYINEKFLKLKNYIQNHITNYRSITGAGLSFYEACLLDNTMFFSDLSYTKEILNNNKDFFYSLVDENRGAISEVIYPYKNQSSHFYKSPFLYLKLKNDKRDEYEKLFEVIKYYFNKFDVELTSRNSFGFRNLSVEYFMNLNDESLVFKIACGKLKGLKYYLTLSIVNLINSKESENLDELYEFLILSEETK